MAHKKAAGSAKNLRDSNPKYRGVKLFWGQFARGGNIIIRQKGDKYKPGLNVYKGKDYTIHARVDGIVSFRKKSFKRFDGRKYIRTVVDVVSQEEFDARQSAKSAAVSNVSPVKKAKKPSKASKKAVTKAAPVKKEAKKNDSSSDKDDLTKIEGIGPKIQELFYAADINTFADLSASKVADLRKILSDAGPRFAMHDPKTWKKQATLAKNGKWDELKKLQDELDGGK